MPITFAPIVVQNRQSPIAKSPKLQGVAKKAKLQNAVCARYI